MSDFDGVEDSQGSAVRLPKLTSGEYLLEVMSNKLIDTRKFGKTAFREFIIKEATGDGALPAGTMAKAKPIYLKDDGALARISEYVRGLTGAPKVDAKICDAVFSSENPLKGKLVRTRVYEDTSDKGHKYLKYDWFFVENPKAK